eukprot:356009-Chlamydomonas_euryale.AAC.6
MHASQPSICSAAQQMCCRPSICSAAQQMCCRPSEQEDGEVGGARGYKSRVPERATTPQRAATPWKAGTLQVAATLWNPPTPAGL